MRSELLIQRVLAGTIPEQAIRESLREDLAKDLKKGHYRDAKGYAYRIDTIERAGRMINVTGKREDRMGYSPWRQSYSFYEETGLVPSAAPPPDLR